jgi:hypothetical protein
VLSDIEAGEETYDGIKEETADEDRSIMET